MEQFQELADAAQKKIMLADHILNQSLPVLKDPRLLVSALENVFLAYSYSIGALLHYERLFKRIPQFEDTFEAKYRLIASLGPTHGLKQEDINTFKDLRDILVRHKKSPMEFSRHELFVICSSDYDVKTIDAPYVKNMISSARQFVRQISSKLAIPA